MDQPVEDMVSIILLMAADRATTLVEELDDRKLAGEPAVVAINVADIHWVLSTAAARTASPSITRVVDRSMWWGFGLPYLLAYPAVGVALAVTHPPWTAAVAAGAFSWGWVGVAMVHRQGGLRRQWERRG